MPRRQDMYSQIGDELAEWIESTSDQIAAALMGDGPAPFSPSLTAQERLEFYDRAFFNADGSPNITGREQQMQRLGAAGYAQALRTVLDHRHPDSIRRQQPMMQQPGGAY